MKTIHIIARSQFTYRSITVHLSFEHRPHTTCHWFRDSPSFPAAQLTTPSHDAPARPLLRICLSAIQPELVVSRYIPSCLPVVISQAGCQSLYPKLVVSRYIPSWLSVVISQAGCQSLYPKLVVSRYIPSWLSVVISQAGCQSLYPKLVVSRYIPSWLSVVISQAGCQSLLALFKLCCVTPFLISAPCSLPTDCFLVTVLQYRCLLTTYHRLSLNYCSIVTFSQLIPGRL